MYYRVSTVKVFGLIAFYKTRWRDTRARVGIFIGNGAQDNRIGGSGQGELQARRRGQDGHRCRGRRPQGSREAQRTDRCCVYTISPPEVDIWKTADAGRVSHSELVCPIAICGRGSSRIPHAIEGDGEGIEEVGTKNPVVLESHSMTSSNPLYASRKWPTILLWGERIPKPERTQEGGLGPDVRTGQPVGFRQLMIDLESQLSPAKPWGIVERHCRIVGETVFNHGGISFSVNVRNLRRNRAEPVFRNDIARKRVRDPLPIDLSERRRIVDLTGIDEKELGRIDRRLLEVIHTSYKGGPVGIDALASSLNEETDTIEDVVFSGEWAIARLTWRSTDTLKGGEPIQLSGKAISLCKRQPDGSWKTVWDIWNSDAPLPSVPTN